MNLIDRVEKIYDLFHQGAIPTLTQHEVNPNLDTSSRLQYIYFTLPVCLNFQRSSPAMWASALKTYDDPETNYLFYPEKVVNHKYEKIQKDLRKHGLSVQPNKNTDIWIKISTTLNEQYNNDPRQIIQEGNSDVEKIISIIQKTRKEDFPYLRGPKLSNYWLHILDKYTDIKLKNKDKISIIPDTHIIQSSIHLGVVSKDAKISEIEKAWFDLLKDSKLSPVDMHAVLWNWSRNNFQPKV